MRRSRRSRGRFLYFGKVLAGSGFALQGRSGRAMGCRMSTGNETKGFALLIKAPRVV